MNCGEKKNGDEMKNRLISFFYLPEICRNFIFFSLVYINSIVATADKKEIMQN